MGVAATHYAILGVAVTDKKKVKEFFGKEEKFLDFTEEYNDNGYKEKPTPNKSGIHMIVDGMNGDYIVIGKILSKGIEEGMPFTQMAFDPESKTVTFSKQLRDADPVGILAEIRKIDEAMGTNFASLPLQYIAFTHWH